MPKARRPAFPFKTSIYALQNAGTGAQNQVEPMRHKSDHAPPRISGVSSSSASRPDTFNERLELSTWFSSLRALQEAAFHPEMELYSTDWKRPEDPTGLPVTLRLLTKFLHVAASGSNGLSGFNEHPMAPIEPCEFPSANQRQLPIPAGSRQLTEFMETTRPNDLRLAASPNPLHSGWPLLGRGRDCPNRDAADTLDAWIGQVRGLMMPWLPFPRSWLRKGRFLAWAKVLARANLDLPFLACTPAVPSSALP